MKFSVVVPRYNEAENLPPPDFSLDLYALYLARVRGLELLRFDVLFPERPRGRSHWNTGLAGKWKFIRRTAAFSLKLKKGLGL
ncbi:MAG: hypothetical protein A2089_07905 [Elusimicrobia bacterium GWD2_63_28]|nr:MAG: hypothetical protein A2089_07905 [Elusimicrobia bacterium GWD2_63_28]